MKAIFFADKPGPHPGPRGPGKPQPPRPPKPGKPK